MDNFRKPEMILCIITTAALIGTSTYFYKKNQSLEEELEKIDDRLSTTVNKVQEMGKYGDNIQQIGQAFKNLRATVDSQKSAIEDFHNLIEQFRNTIDRQQDFIDAIVTELRNNDIEIKMPYNDRRFNSRFYPDDRLRSRLDKPTDTDRFHDRDTDRFHDRDTDRYHDRDTDRFHERDRERDRNRTRDYERERDHDRYRDYDTTRSKRDKNLVHSNQDDDDDDVLKQVEAIKAKKQGSKRMSRVNDDSDS